MRTSINHNLTFLAIVSTFAALSIVLFLNFQSAYSKNPEVSYLDVNDTSSVSKFTVASWFKTSNNYKSDAFIVNKAGDGGNMNYGIWMTGSEKIQGGFDNSNGKPMYATSPLSYSDGKWHYAMVTFDGSIINLYVDGIQVATKSASGSPDNGGNQPVRVGANSEQPSDYFIGDVDEVRVWKSALTPLEALNAFNGDFDSKNQILYLDFSQPIAILNNTAQINATSINETGIQEFNATANETGIQPINATANETGIQEFNATANETGIQEFNATANETGIQPINATANETGLQAVNETSTKENATARNETGTQGINATATNETSKLSQLITKNETDNANVTSNNNRPIERSQIINETGLNNETLLGNQTSVPKLSEENALPNAFDQSVSIDQNIRTDITLVAEDNNKDRLQYDITADPSHGSLDNFNKEKGTVTYIPQKDYFGKDKFSFRAIDDKGGEGDPANVDIQINTVSELNETKKTGPANSQEKISNETSTEQTGKTNSQEKISNETSTEQTGKTNSQEKISNETRTAEQNAQSNSVEEPNQPPKADAGDDQYVKVNTQVKLDGGKSSDDDGKIISYKWEQTDGPKVNIKKADEQTVTFDVPDSAADSKLSFKLTVADDKDASSSDEVTLQVGNEVPVQTDTNQQTDTNNKQTDTNNQQTDSNNKQTDTNNQQSNAEEQIKAAQNVPPKADAGDNQNVEVNTEVKLDGGKSSDDDGKIASYKWERTDGPKVDLKNADKETATFDVPESAADSKLTFKLTVVDDKDASSSDDVTVEVKAAQNVPPKADAGDNQNVEVNSEVKLDGGKSSDDDGKIASYKWERTDGPKVDLKNADKETATFDVPESAADSKLTFKLTVVDDKDASSSDDANVEVGKISKDVSSTNDDTSTKDASNNKGKSN
jgi:hypothetical protein